MFMRLKKFKVENFRSVKDSGWVDSNNVTTLVGVNAAGKSNLLLALWKLNPATGGEINLLDDMPRSKFSEWRDSEDQPIFIRCEFEITQHRIINKIIELTNCKKSDVKIVSVSRNYSGTRFINFPEFEKISSVPSEKVVTIIEDSLNNLAELEEQGATEKGIKEKSIQAHQDAKSMVSRHPNVSKEILQKIIETINIPHKKLQKSTIQPQVQSVIDELSLMKDKLNVKSPSANQEVRNLIVENFPKFVYYSNYGNLDSEIYLPHVIENMNRSDLSSSMEAKVRTLKVLFEFVNLDPTEILELGTETKYDTNQRERVLSDEEIKEIAEKKKEREVLLQSAALRLTREFKSWWKQGHYKFRFQADGKHFKIWVSDDKRPEEISLEGRSTGLQWFLSFYLIFLVDSKDAHDNAILLLDEAGVSLHPLDQKDLAHFLENLAQNNQIVHTTHSPFLVDTNHIDRVKVVYVDENGHTIASNDLRAGDSPTNKNTSVYAVHAALGLSVSDVLLQGCKSVIVEGPSDQYYLNTVKNYLINKGKFMPKEEIIFIPSGGVKGIKALSSLVSGKDGELPVVLIDSDKSGKGLKESLLKEPS